MSGLGSDLIAAIKTASDLIIGGEESTTPDPMTLVEATDHERSGKQVELIYQIQNIQERKRYARWIFNLICVWLGLILLITVVNGIDIVPLELSDAVVITLITTTTANVTIFFTIVIKSLFPSSSTMPLTTNRKKTKR